MEIDKETILSMLKEQGKTNEAQQAEQELPDKVDSERDGGLLERFGLSPQELLGRFTGGKGLPGL